MSREELEKIFSPYAQKDKILEEFEYGKKYIEKITGLTLSNIEVVGLRKITEEIMKQMVKDGIDDVSGFTAVASYEEIPPRFFQEFFDIDISTYNNLPRNESGDFDDATKEWFKGEQEKRHLI